MKTKELYVTKCHECNKVFRTENPQEIFCPECLKFRQPSKPKKKKKVPKKALTVSEILHISKVYQKVNNKYLNYGTVVALVEQNVDRCVCCGEIVPEGRQICPKCEKVVE